MLWRQRAAKTTCMIIASAVSTPSCVPLITTSLHMHIKHGEIELPDSRNLYFAAEIMMQPSNTEREN
jgi:hypothetical protein